MHWDLAWAPIRSTPGQLRYVFEGEGGDALQVVPTFANVLAYPGFWRANPARASTGDGSFTRSRSGV